MSLPVYSRLPLKERFDITIIDSAFRRIINNAVKKIKTHFVIVGDSNIKEHRKLASFIREGMKKYNIKSVMVTKIHLMKWNLITKEAMESFYKGEDYSHKVSVNDDLEALLEDLRMGKETDYEFVRSYFLPKLTEEELKSVRRQDTTYFETFFVDSPDVEVAEMNLSESDSKFARADGIRVTVTIPTSLEILTNRSSLSCCIII